MTASVNSEGPPNNPPKRWLFLTIVDLIFFFVALFLVLVGVSGFVAPPIELVSAIGVCLLLLPFAGFCLWRLARDVAWVTPSGVWAFPFVGRFTPADQIRGVYLKQEWIIDGDWFDVYVWSVSLVKKSEPGFHGKSPIRMWRLTRSGAKQAGKRMAAILDVPVHGTRIR